MEGTLLADRRRLPAHREREKKDKGQMMCGIMWLGEHL
jgi:hypothetical protein